MRTIKFLEQFEEKIRKGEKTATIRPVVENENPYEVGERVCWMQKQIAIEILSVRRSRLKSLTIEELKLEGLEVPGLTMCVRGRHPSKEDREKAHNVSLLYLFEKTWNEIYGTGDYESNPFVYAYTFKVIL